MTTPLERQPAGPQGTPVSPEDCALAIAIPRTPGDCEAQAGSQTHEFVRRVVMPMLHPAPSSAREAWERGYACMIDRLAGIAGAAAGPSLDPSGRTIGGVTVVWDADRAALGGLLRRFRVVTLLAHSPFPDLRLADLLEPRTVWRELSRPHPRMCHETLRALRRDARIRNAGSLEELVARLNARINESRTYFAFDGQGERPAVDPTDPIRDEHLTALHLYEALPGAIRSPVVIELADGFLDFESLVNLIPPSFDGTLDLLTCCNIWFREALRRRRPACAGFLGGKRPAWFLDRLTLYRHIISLLASQPMPYADARDTVHLAAAIWSRHQTECRSLCQTGIPEPQS